MSIDLPYARGSLMSRIKCSLGVDIDLEEVNAIDNWYRKGDEQE
jgi:hypothetical protein